MFLAVWDLSEDAPAPSRLLNSMYHLFFIYELVCLAPTIGFCQLSYRNVARKNIFRCPKKHFLFFLIVFILLLPKNHVYTSPHCYLREGAKKTVFLHFSSFLQTNSYISGRNIDSGTHYRNGAIVRNAATPRQ